MFRMKMMSNRRFVPTNFIFILILGFLSLVLWETTRFFGRVQPALTPPVLARRHPGACLFRGEFHPLPV